MQEKLGNGFHSNCLNESQNNNFILIENPTKKILFWLSVFHLSKGKNKSYKKMWSVTQFPTLLSVSLKQLFYLIETRWAQSNFR